MTTTVPPEAGHAAAAVYTVAQVALLLDLSLGSTYTLIRAGEIPAKKMGARWVIPKRRFHLWLDTDDQTARRNTEDGH
jgi:excisionase family DNA binding protein